MKRRLLIIAICLLLGVIVNVAVAWGCAAWADLDTEPSSGTSEDGTTMIGRWSSKFGTLIHYHISRTATYRHPLFESPRMDEVSPYWLRFPSAAYESGLIDNEDRITDARGWPALTMWSEYVWPPYGPPVPVKGGLRLTSPHSVTNFGPQLPRALPLRPIWPGFAVNTLFYAAILWLLMSGPFALRRFIRVKGGLCPACAYPRGQSEVCSECGKALPSRHIIV